MKIFKVLFAVCLFIALFVLFVYLVEFAFPDYLYDPVRTAAKIIVFIISGGLLLFMIKGIIFIQIDVEKIVQQRIASFMQNYIAKKPDSEK